MIREILSAAIPRCAVDVVALTALFGAILGCRQAIPVAVASVETAICVADEWVKCKSTQASDETCVLNVARICETDAATIARILDSDTKFAVFYKPKAECK